MKSSTTLSLLLGCCCLALLSSPVLAQGTAEPPAEPEAAIAPTDSSPATDCRTSAVLFGGSDLSEPVPLAGCSVSVECDDGSMVSCTGDSTCTTSGPNNRCVTCDGQQQGSRHERRAAKARQRHGSKSGGKKQRKKKSR